MSDAPMPDQPSHDAPQTKQHTAAKRRTFRVPGGRWTWIVLLLLLIGVGVQPLISLRFWEALDREAGQVATVDGRLTALEAAMADQDHLRQEIRQMQQALQQERDLLSLDRLEQQLDAGWQIWQGTGSTKALVMALQDAQRRLASQPSAAAQALRMAVGQDLQALKSQRAMDLSEAVQTIDQVIASIDQLPLIQDRRIPAEGAAMPVAAGTDPSPATLLERARQWGSMIAQEVWQAIRGMIRVQRLDRAEAGLVAPEQKVFLQQGLRLLLLDARHALVMRNPGVYQQTLKQAQAWITKYTDGASTLVKEDLASLQTLQTLQIDPTVVSLEETRKALDEARALLTGAAAPEAVEALPQAAAPASETTKGASE